MKRLQQLALNQIQTEIAHARKILLGEEVKREEVGTTGKPSERLFTHLQNALGWIEAIKETDE